MRKILLIAALLVASVSFFVSPAVATDYTREEKVIKLRLVFEKYNSPFLGMEEAFLDVADTYSIDWTLLPAISGTESSFAKRMPANCNNPYGWGITGTKRLCFSNLENATKAVAEGLTTKYNTTSLQTIARKYNPSYTDHWVKNTTFFMNKIKNVQVPLAAMPINL